MWIEPLEQKESDGNGIVLSCPNPFHKKRIQENYGSLIEFEFWISVSRRRHSSRLAATAKLIFVWDLYFGAWNFHV